VDRIFLDANVLFSAAYRSDSRLHQLWKLPNLELLTSTYAVQEARVNLPDDERRGRLEKLLESLTVVVTVADRPQPKGVDLPVKDRPILFAAIAARATHLLTGDTDHFGRYFYQTVEGVLILPPSEYLRHRK
jgi:predicted nucleic acid-binding protein